MILSELAGGIAERFQQFGDGRIFLLQSDRRAGHPHLGEARADGVLAADEARAPRGTALLRVVVGEGHPFFRDAIDVWGPIAHHATAEMADVPHADVVTPEDQDVRFLCCHDVFLPLRKMIKSHANNEGLSASNAIERNNGFNTLLLVQQRTKRIEAIWHALHSRCGPHHCVWFVLAMLFDPLL